MNDMNAGQDSGAETAESYLPPTLEETLAVTGTAPVKMAQGTASKRPKRATKGKEDEAATSPLVDRLRQKTDDFNFDELLSLSHSSDSAVCREEFQCEQENRISSTNLVSQHEASSALQEKNTMAESEHNSGADITLRLVEQLTKTNERLERLEAALREVSLLTALQREPVRGDTPPSESDTDTAANAADSAVAASSGIEANQEAEAFFRSGVALCQMKKFDEAAAAWQRVLDLQPDNAYAMANIGIVFTEQARWTEARDLFARVLRLQPDNAEASFGLGMADAQLGNYTAAIAALENTLRLQPDNADARYNLALVKKRVALNNSPARQTTPTNGTDSPGAQQTADGVSSVPATRNEEAGSSSSLKEDIVPQFAAEQTALVVAPDSAQAASGAANRTEPARIIGDLTSLPGRRPVKRPAGFARLAMAAVGVAVLAGGLFFVQFRASHPTDRSANTTQVSVPTGGVAAPPVINSTPASKPDVTAPIASLLNKASPTSPTPTKVAEPKSDNKPMGSQPVVVHNRPAQPYLRSWPGRHFASKSQHSQRGAHPTTAGHGSSGYNRSVDKLLDQMR